MIFSSWSVNLLIKITTSLTLFYPTSIIYQCLCLNNFSPTIFLFISTSAPFRSQYVPIYCSQSPLSTLFCSIGILNSCSTFCHEAVLFVLPILTIGTVFLLILLLIQLKLNVLFEKKLPPFYSSHTVHPTNQKESTLRKIENDVSFLLAIKLRDLNISLSNSIEMDKVFVNQFDLSSTRHCFKLLRCLGFSSSIPSVMILGNESFHTDFDIALAFNRFFASVFNKNVAHSAPLQCEVSTIRLSDLSLSLSDVRYLLECSDDSNAVSADGIPSFLLYQCSNILCTPVFELFNWILKNQHWPDIWKQANVTPLHKSGAHNDIANYRPILPRLSLILERILFNNIYPKIRHLVKLEQHGFMKSRSTVSQMIMYLDAVYSSRDTNSSAVSVYFDISKAFDSVPHIKLLSKLANFGFDSEFLHLIHSYLTNRSQCVKINQTLPSPLPVTSGVPQGSVLGPLLFLLFANDIVDNVENCSFYLFPDNLKIFSTSPNSLVRDDINALLDWSNLNGLQFHPKNFKALNFEGHDESVHFLLGAEYLPFVNQIEDLGFIVSSSLS